MGDSNFGNSDSSYKFSEFVVDVETALVNKFGRDKVTRGNKAFDIHSNSYRIDADVVACFEYRYYYKDGSFTKGTKFFAKDGTPVINYPEQHYINGINKNNATGRRFKRVVRILKRLKIKMVEDGIQGLDNISSFLIECLVWNAQDRCFNQPTYTDDVHNVLVNLYQFTKDDSTCNEWGEVSEQLYLFRPGRKYTREEANNFIVKAYNYLFE